MKKIIFLSTIILYGIFFAGCSHKLSEEQLFEKKQECNNYKTDIEKQAKSHYDDYLNIEEITYSSTFNSCIYSIHEVYGGYTIYDYFSEKAIYSTIEADNCTSENITQCMYNEYSKKMEELKGE